MRPSRADHDKIQETFLPANSAVRHFEDNPKRLCNPKRFSNIQRFLFIKREKKHGIKRNHYRRWSPHAKCQNLANPDPPTPPKLHLDLRRNHFPPAFRTSKAKRTWSSNISEAGRFQLIDWWLSARVLFGFFGVSLFFESLKHQTTNLPLVVFMNFWEKITRSLNLTW